MNTDIVGYFLFIFTSIFFGVLTRNLNLFGIQFSFLQGFHPLNPSTYPFTFSLFRTFENANPELSAQIKDGVSRMAKNLILRIWENSSEHERT